MYSPGRWLNLNGLHRMARLLVTHALGEGFKFEDFGLALDAPWLPSPAESWVDCREFLAQMSSAKNRGATARRFAADINANVVVWDRSCVDSAAVQYTAAAMDALGIAQRVIASDFDTPLNLPQSLAGALVIVQTWRMPNSRAAEQAPSEGGHYLVDLAMPLDTNLWPKTAEDRGNKLLLEAIELQTRAYLARQTDQLTDAELKISRAWSAAQITHAPSVLVLMDAMLRAGKTSYVVAIKNSYAKAVEGLPRASRRTALERRIERVYREALRRMKQSVGVADEGDGDVRMHIEADDSDR